MRSFVKTKQNCIRLAGLIAGVAQFVSAAGHAAYRPKASQPWELCDVSTDPRESQHLAAAQLAILAKLSALAQKAQVPAVKGTFTSTERHERDRRAKFGKQDEVPTLEGKAQMGKVNI